MKLEHAPKTVEFPPTGWLHFWYANNGGRGADNCTIVLSSSRVRAGVSAKQTGVISKTRTSSWRGKVNFSTAIREKLGV